jgi:hypothetical protein
MDVRPRRCYLVRLGGVGRVVSLPARFKTKAVLSTAFRLEGESGPRPVHGLGSRARVNAADRSLRPVRRDNFGSPRRAFLFG